MHTSDKNSNVDFIENLASYFLLFGNSIMKASLACNINASSEVLIELVYEGDSLARHEALRNRNTPQWVLKDIFETDKWNKTQCILAGNENIPDDVLLDLSKTNDIYVRRSVAGNPKCGLEILSSLCSFDDNVLKEIVATHPVSNECILINLYYYAKQDNYWPRGLVFRCIEHENFPYDILIDECVNSDDEYFRACAAKSNNITEDILDYLSEDESCIVREQVGKNINASPNTLYKLSHDESYFVRSAVARNNSTKLDLLEMLSADEFYEVREGVASNISISLSLMEKLSIDENAHVRNCIINNNNCTKNILCNLKDDKDLWVRGSIASNENSPKEILTALSKDYDEHVRRHVALNGNTPFEVLKAFLNDERIRIVVPQNPSIFN